MSLSWTDIASICVIGGFDLYQRMSVYRSIIQGVNPHVSGWFSSRLIEATEANQGKPGVSARLSAIPAPEGKTRVIAKLDYWSQEALKPLHDKIMRVLKRIPRDLTFSQNSSRKVITREVGNFYWSIDLKSATDRFPILFQFKVLEHLFGTKFAKRWVDLLNRPYMYGNKMVTYGVGQPMGAYSSWAVFALCHHVVICGAHIKAGVPLGKTYCVLGDDVVITNDLVAKYYLESLDRLGVQVSSKKTHKSTFRYEIAKRWYTDTGSEFTPFPLSSIASTSKSIPLTLQAFYEATVKGWSIPMECSLPEVVRGISCVLKENTKNKFLKHSIKISQVNWIVGEILRGRCPGVEGIRFLQALFNLPCLPSASSPAQGKIPDSMLTNCVVDLFQQSSEQPGQGFRDVGFNTLIARTTPGAILPQMVQSCLDSTPQISVYAGFETQYLEILQKRWDFDTVYSGNWDLAMRALTVPDTSVAFSARNKDVKVLFITKIAKTLVERLKTLRASPYNI
jgi:hypothetical protein